MPSQFAGLLIRPFISLDEAKQVPYYFFLNNSLILVFFCLKISETSFKNVWERRIR